MDLEPIDQDRVRQVGQRVQRQGSGQAPRFEQHERVHHTQQKILGDDRRRSIPNAQPTPKATKDLSLN